MGPAGARWSANIALVSALKGQMETPPHSLVQITQTTGFLGSEGKRPVLSYNSSHKHTQSQKDICSKGLSQRKRLFYFFIHF